MDVAILVLVERYLNHLSKIIDLDSYDLLSLGVTSTNSLVLACAFSHQIKRQFGSSIQIVLGSHSYENFSLCFRHEDLNRSEYVNQFFDSIIFSSENFANQLASFLGKSLQPLSANLSFEEGQQIFKDSLYKKMILQPVNKNPLLFRLSRNPCYWRRCTFCVQNTKYVAGNSFIESAEVRSALVMLDILYDAGFKFFIFSDEAVSMSTLKQLTCHIDKQSIDIRWTPRVTVHPDFDPALIRMMAKTGCFEVLTGLETVSEETAEKMNKRVFPNRRIQAERFLKNLDEHGIGSYLNLIYAFPTESDDEFHRSSYDFYLDMHDQYKNITWQFNRFTLFYGSKVFKHPENFGISYIEPVNSEDDLKLEFDYEDQFGRRPDSWNPEYFSASIGMSIDSYNEMIEKYGQLSVNAAFQINYGSFGLINKANSGTNITDLILR